MSLDGPVEEEDVVNEEAASMKDIPIQKSKNLPRRGTNAWRAANHERTEASGEISAGDRE